MDVLQVQIPLKRGFSQNTDNMFKLDGSEEIGSESFHPNKFGDQTDKLKLLQKLNDSTEVNSIVNSSEKMSQSSGRSSSSYVSSESVLRRTDGFKQETLKSDEGYFRNFGDLVSINYALFTFFIVFIILYVIPPLSFLVKPKSNQRILWKVVLTAFISAVIVYSLSLVKVF